MSTHENPVARQRHGEVDKFTCKKQAKRYHISDDLQALAIALSPLWLAILLAVYLRGSQ
jgi:hypothetical protein